MCNIQFEFNFCRKFKESVKMRFVLALALVLSTVLIEIVLAELVQVTIGTPVDNFRNFQRISNQRGAAPYTQHVQQVRIYFRKIRNSWIAKIFCCTKI